MTILRLWAHLVTLPSDLEICIENLQKGTVEFVWIICTVRNLRNPRVRTSPEKSLIDAHGREACAHSSAPNGDAAVERTRPAVLVAKTTVEFGSP